MRFSCASSCRWRPPVDIGGLCAATLRVATLRVVATATLAAHSADIGPQTCPPA